MAEKKTETKDAVKGNGKLSIDDILNARRAPEITVSICIDPTIQLEIQALELEIRAAKTQINQKGLAGGGVRAKEQQLAKLIESAAESFHDFRFRGLPRKEFDTLLRAHPPTEAQIKQTKLELGPQARPPFNEDTFVPALLAATCIDPPMTIEQATTICDDWTTPEVESLFNGAWAVCKDIIPVPFYKRGIEATMTTD